MNIIGMNIVDLLPEVMDVLVALCLFSTSSIYGSRSSSYSPSRGSNISPDLNHKNESKTRAKGSEKKIDNSKKEFQNSQVKVRQSEAEDRIDKLELRKDIETLEQLKHEVIIILGKIENFSEKLKRKD